MYRILLLALAFASFPSAAQPSVEAITAEVTDNIATEYAECAAYFAILQGAFANSGKPTESDKFKKASDKAAEFSLISAKQSRSEEMATNVTLARFEMSLKAMQKTIDNNYSNISLLMNKHSDSCTEEGLVSGLAFCLPNLSSLNFLKLRSLDKRHFASRIWPGLPGGKPGRVQCASLIGTLHYWYVGIWWG